MKLSAFGIAGDPFRVSVMALKDGAVTVDIVNGDGTDIVLHFDNAHDASLFGEQVTAAAQQHCGHATKVDEEAVCLAGPPPGAKDCRGNEFYIGDPVKALNVDGSSLKHGQTYTVKTIEEGLETITLENVTGFFTASRFEWQPPF